MQALESLRKSAATVQQLLEELHLGTEQVKPSLDIISSAILNAKIHCDCP
jgi:hypothetical protein